jgi:signal transduction histidine kinase
LLLGLLLSAALGSLLAWNINRPIQKATSQIYKLAHGELREPQTEFGPDEVRMVIRATNYLVEQLNNLEQSRRQMLANLVHELGRPLGALRSAIQALAKGAGKDPAFLAELTQGMDEETLHLQRLVEDLAQLHEQSLGVVELDRQPLALSKWLPGILPPWRQAAADKRLHWSETIPVDLPVIDADPGRLAQVLGNLISNAVKYTQLGGTISVTAGADPDSAWIRVSDNGPGIQPEEQEKVFSPYYRGQQRQRIRQGMGLGLSITRDLVSAHGGSLELESTPGLGSHFTVRLPRTS